MVWLGDFNVRVGVHENDAERDVLGEFGEHCKRSRHTDRFIELLFEFKMTSLVGQKPHPGGKMIYSWYQKGAENVHCIPDRIFVSQSMFENGMSATILPLTLTDKDDHNPVHADIRMHRAKKRRK